MSRVNLKRLAAWCLLIIASAALIPVGCSVWINTDPDGVFGVGGAGGVAGSGGVGGGGGPTGGGGTGGVYAQAEFGEPADFADADEFESHSIPLPPDGANHVTLGIDFVWSDVAARPASFDLSAQLSGVPAPLMQVFSVRDRAFVRAGTHLEPIEADAEYRLEITRTSAAVWAQVIRAEDDTVVLSGPVEEIGAGSDDTVTLVTVRESARVRLGVIRAWRSEAPTPE